METVMRVADAKARHGAGFVRHRVARGMWQRPCRGVIVTHNGPVTRDEAWAIALASAPPRSALAGPTALEVHGMTGFEADRIHVVVPAGGRAPSWKGLVVHESTELSDADVHPLHEPRSTRVARSVVDLASWCINDRYARAVVIAALQQGMANTARMRDALTRRGPCKRRGLIIESILDAAGGIQSLPERDFDALWRAAGLPRPTRQRRVRGKDGRYHLDASWESLGMSAEIHGIPHQAVRQWDADLLRANEIVIGGERLLIFSSYAIRREQVAVADQLFRMARACGWTGPEPDLHALRALQQHKRTKFRRRRGRRRPISVRSSRQDSANA
jgi:hypothetical protein